MCDEIQTSCYHVEGSGLHDDMCIVTLKQTNKKLERQNKMMKQAIDKLSNDQRKLRAKGKDDFVKIRELERKLEKANKIIKYVAENDQSHWPTSFYDALEAYNGGEDE